MKKPFFIRRTLFVAIMSLAILFVGCTKDIKNDIKDLDKRVTSLENLMKTANDNISTLRDIVAVLQNKDHVTSVVDIVENGVVIGYTISFEKASPIKVYRGTGAIIGVAQHEDGIYYWTQRTIDGSIFITDVDGKKIPATVSTPIVRIYNGAWETSIDGGRTWIGTGIGATGPTGLTGDKGDKGDKGDNGIDGDSWFEDLIEYNYYYELVLSDGSGSIELLKYLPMSIIFTDQTLLGDFVSGELRNIAFSLQNANFAYAMSVTGGWKVTIDSDAGIMSVIVPDETPTINSVLRIYLADDEGETSVIRTFTLTQLLYDEYPLYQIWWRSGVEQGVVYKENDGTPGSGRILYKNSNTSNWTNAPTWASNIAPASIWRVPNRAEYQYIYDLRGDINDKLYTIGGNQFVNGTAYWTSEQVSIFNGYVARFGGTSMSTESWIKTDNAPAYAIRNF